VVFVSGVEELQEILGRPGSPARTVRQRYGWGKTGVDPPAAPTRGIRVRVAA
jgi:hypothetical protein